MNATFFSIGALTSALEQIQESADKARVRIALVGNAAMQCYGDQHFAFSVELLAERQFRLASVENIPVTVKIAKGLDRTLILAAIRDARTMVGAKIRTVGPEFLVVLGMVSRQEAMSELHLAFLSNMKDLDLAKTRKLLTKHVGHYTADRWEYLREHAVLDRQIELRTERGEPLPWQARRKAVFA